jgi:hypothetical protein
MDEDQMLQRLPCRLRRDLLKSMNVGLLAEMKVTLRRTAALQLLLACLAWCSKSVLSLISR